MKVTVLGGGNWGTTVASLVARRHDAMIWARNSAVVEEINKDHRNSAYLAGFDLNPKLKATDDFEQAVRHAELLIMGVPTGAVRETSANTRKLIRPWIPVVSLPRVSSRAVCCG